MVLFTNYVLFIQQNKLSNRMSLNVMKLNLNINQLRFQYQDLIPAVINILKWLHHEVLNFSHNSLTTMCSFIT